MRIAVMGSGGLGGYFPPLVLGATNDKVLPQYGLGLALLAAVAGAALLFSQFGIRSSDRRARAT